MPESRMLEGSSDPVHLINGSKREIQGEAPSRILYLDSVSLTRDCISNQLAGHLPDLAIESAPSVRDVIAKNGRSFALAVLHTHTASIWECAVAAELSLISQAMPNVPVVLLSGSEAVESIISAFRNGIRGYVPTTLTMKDAAEAIRFVLVGGTFVPPSVLAASTRPGSIDSPQAANQGKLSCKFTLRQREVLGRLWQGKANKAIAYELHMCESTVKVHVRHIMKKLHARNRTQIVLLTHPMSHADMAPASNGATEAIPVNSPADAG
jgi:DNA-binding NarL/FixJ family response regulator